MNKLDGIPIPKLTGRSATCLCLTKQGLPVTLEIADEMGPIFQFKFADAIGVLCPAMNWLKKSLKNPVLTKHGEGAIESSRVQRRRALYKLDGRTQLAESPQHPSAELQPESDEGIPSHDAGYRRPAHSKWSRLNQDESIDVPDDMTRLTLDTIGLCGFNYRFNSFYREGQHPFIESMVRGLSEAMRQTKRFPLQDKLMIQTKRRFNSDVESMFLLLTGSSLTGSRPRVKAEMTSCRLCFMRKTLRPAKTG
ncbi:hypothetical protein PO124_30085 [Bacillus licheniformis]|nr:hypothetical protein [Bacillus licheniformis]